MTTQMSEIISRDEYDTYALSVTPAALSEVEIGSTVRPSRIWADDEPTDEYLDGACGIAIEGNPARALRRLASYPGITVLLIAGNQYEHGEDDHEIVISDAVVIGAWAR